MITFSKLYFIIVTSISPTVYNPIIGSVYLSVLLISAPFQSC